MQVRTRIGVEKARVQQLGEVGYHTQINQRADVIGFGLRKLLSVYPLSHVNTPG